MNKKVWLNVLLFLIVPTLLTKIVLAETTTQQITEPLNKIYDLIKIGVAIIGTIALTIAGAKFMLSGNNVQARDNAKNMAMYAIVGLIIIWTAPLLVNYLTAPVQ